MWVGQFDRGYGRMVELTSSRGVRGHAPPGRFFFLNIEVKSINLLHFESNIRRYMDTSLNTHMKQIYFFFMHILQITPLLNCIFVLLSYSMSWNYFIPVILLFCITIMII